MKNGITRIVIALLNRANNPLRSWRLCESTHKVKSDELEYLDMPRQTGFRNKAPYYITLSVRNERESRQRRPRRESRRGRRSYIKIFLQRWGQSTKLHC